MAMRDAVPDYSQITIGIVAQFSLSLLMAVSSVHRADFLLNDRLGGNVQWAGWQVPFELGRLENAIRVH